MLDILGKIQIIMGKGTAYIIIGLVTALCQLLELRYNQIIAALSAPKRTHSVMYLFPTVDTQNDIAHLFIQKFHNFII